MARWRAGAGTTSGRVLFVEKEGFQPLFERVRLAERFDIAIMSTKGMSVIAARQLVAALSERDVPIVVIGDFDKAGFSIVHTLGHDTARYLFDVTPTVTDLGLRLVDVQAMGLASEPVAYGDTVDPRINLRACGATEEECAFLVTERGRHEWTGERVELNAMRSEQLVAWIEEQLRAHGLTTKLVPDRKTLEAAYRRAARLLPIERMLRDADDAAVTVPRALGRRVADALAKHPRRGPGDRRPGHGEGRLSVDQLLTLDDVARVLRMTVRQVRALCRQTPDPLPTVALSHRQRRVRPEDLAAWLSGRAVAGSVENLCSARLTGPELRRLRLKAGFTQKEFAQQLHLATAYFASLERGEAAVREVVALAATHMATCRPTKNRRRRQRP